MSKHKHQKERDKAHQRILEEMARTRLLDKVPVTIENEIQSTDAAHPEGERKKEVNSMETRERLKPSSFTDYSLALFTALLVVVAVFQMVITQRQLDVMRKDQRPWIKLSFDTFVTQVGSPVGGNLHQVNNGKTPAKNIAGKFAIEKVENGRQPRLDSENAPISFTFGSFFPNDPQTQALNMQQSVTTPKGTSYQSASLSQQDYDDFVQGRIFFVAYAKVSYSDFFGVQHWTQYCSFYTAPESPAAIVPKQYTAQDCTNYNNVDDN